MSDSANADGPASPEERRSGPFRDRRRVARGGRRSGDPAGHFPTLMVADGYAGARIPYVRYLNLFGFRVEAVTDGQQLMNRIAAASPHVILTDINLPRMPAWQLSEWLAATAPEHPIPIIVMADRFQDERRAHVPHDAAGVLMKPFALSAMLDEVRRALRRYPPAAPSPAADTPAH